MRIAACPCDKALDDLDIPSWSSAASIHHFGAGNQEGAVGDDKPVRLIRPADRSEGQMTTGMRREQAVNTDRSWAGHVTTEAGMVSGWHHHGDFESHIYVVSGGLRLESGPGGQDVIDAQPGDFIFVPPRTVHREGNPTSAEATVIVVRAGSGEAVFNVDGPAET
jgi:uncharacterized RmlC-like cupin family protein